MPKLPTTSGREVALALVRLGFEQVGQAGSHPKLRRGTMICIVPLHRELKRGTLGGILTQAGVSVEDLVRTPSQ